MLLITSTHKYEGKILDHFEDEDGNHLDDLCMLENVVIVFSDGEKIQLIPDQRGTENYISQKRI